MKEGFKINIETSTIKNQAYRKVLYTTKQTQLVLMSLLPNEDIPRETHPSITQFIRIENGSCVAYLNGKQLKLKKNDSLIIPSGTEHYIKNTGKTELKLYTLYSPPNHPVGLLEEDQP